MAEAKITKQATYSNAKATGKSDIAGQCPRCGEKPKADGGIYFVANPTIPVSLRWLFISFTVKALLGIYYCPACGFLRVTVDK